MDIPAKDLTRAESIKECQEKCGKTYVYRRPHGITKVDTATRNREMYTPPLQSHLHGVREPPRRILRAGVSDVEP